MKAPKKAFIVSILRIEDDSYQVEARTKEAAEEKAKRIWEEEHPWCEEPWSVEVDEVSV